MQQWANSRVCKVCTCSFISHSLYGVGMASSKRPKMFFGHGYVCLIAFFLALPTISSAPIPGDWQYGVQNGTLLFSAAAHVPHGEFTLRSFATAVHFSESSRLRMITGYAPNIGNGALAWSLDNSFMYIGGVFNGFKNITPSHRAAVPSPLWSRAVTAIDGNASAVQFVGAMLDTQYGRVYNRSYVNSPSCPGFVVETSVFMHAALLDLAIQTWRAWPANSPLQPPPADAAVQESPNTTCQIMVPVIFNASLSPDFEVSFEASGRSQTSPTSRPTWTWLGSTLQAETHQIGRRCVAAAFPHEAVQPPSSPLTLSMSPTVWRFVIQADNHTASTPPAPGQGGLVQCASAAPESLLATVRAHSAYYDRLSWAQLWASHTPVWDAWWGHSLHIEGNDTIATAVRASYYYLFAAGREGVQWGVSPGGLASDAYNGHVFWDQETWMLPALLPFRPRYALAMLQYREGRLPAAVQRSAQWGYKGAQFPWESAFTGFDCTPVPNPEGQIEQHISGDIAMAARLLWYATGQAAPSSAASNSRLRASPAQVTAIRDPWSDSTGGIAAAVCDFWVCRFQGVNTSQYPPVHAADLESGGDRCGWKPVEGGAWGLNFTIWNVQPPDESAGLVNDSAYTNAVAAKSLQLCGELASSQGGQPDPAWGTLAGSVFLPLSDTLFAPGPVTPEYTGYKGGDINQADVALLSYPLGYGLPGALQRRNLEFYGGVTRANGYFTGDSAYSIAWLALGNRTAADAQFALAFEHMDSEHFWVWKERAFTGGHLNFLTGAGGFLQNFLYGYAGIRYASPGVLKGVSSALLPPYLSTTAGASMQLRGIVLGQCRVLMNISAEQVCFSLLPSDSVSVQAQVLSALRTKPLANLERSGGQHIVRSVRKLLQHIHTAAPCSTVQLIWKDPNSHSQKLVEGAQPVCVQPTTEWEMRLIPVPSP